MFAFHTFCAKRSTSAHRTFMNGILPCCDERRKRIIAVTTAKLQVISGNPDSKIWYLVLALLFICLVSFYPSTAQR
jgi:hypothetical protein